ncbi:hypothetical protein K469DRAFT_758153 [Zopfia rhizophila CBS 207.26]|uniref:SET domain-containing protein n=1 Tax=Zopfia rhizophila CBS 207.26 TaxID=1314779 RepID=A0A6A6EWF2_9PEZI|nr:hypothetical protein K469DRAFT_758153 [Zopfia rhizophila CBS 207.26]
MALDFHRPDIIDEPVVCQVYCEKKGNWARLVNHSCKPCARFVNRVVSRKARVMLQAIRDIWDGVEVTANYGRNFFKNKDCLCETCAQPNQATIDSRNLSSPRGQDRNTRDDMQQPFGSRRYPTPLQNKVNSTQSRATSESVTASAPPPTEINIMRSEASYEVSLEVPQTSLERSVTETRDQIRMEDGKDTWDPRRSEYSDFGGVNEGASPSTQSFMRECFNLDIQYYHSDEEELGDVH